jgi:hypothetical protein
MNVQNKLEIVLNEDDMDEAITQYLISKGYDASDEDSITYSVNTLGAYKAIYIKKFDTVIPKPKV